MRLNDKSAHILFIAVACSCALSLGAYASAAPDTGRSERPPAPAGPNLSNPVGDAANGSPLSDAAGDAAVVHAEPVPAAAVPISSGFDFPVGGALNHEGFEMNNCFSCDWTYYIGHTGEDFDNYREGDPVNSASEGVVVYRGRGPGAWGNVIIVQHMVRGRALYTQYAHLRDMIVVPGQVVGRRQQIGTVGTTGTVAPHLHFEVKDQPRIGHGYTGWPFSGLTIYYDGINYWAPSWFIRNTRHLDSPFGTIDGTRVIPGGFKLWGWAIDPNTAAPIDVHVYLDRAGAAILNASDHRWDVGATFPDHGPYHGYTTSVAAAPGTYEVCTYGINIGVGANAQLECRTVNLTGDPVGGIDDLSLGGGFIRASGWAIDPDTTSPIGVHFYVNGEFAGAADAIMDRQDVLEGYPEYGGGHGFVLDLPRVAGENQVCVYGLNVAAGGNALLGCRTINVGLEEFTPVPPAAGRQYHWTWYDGAGANDWLILANPAAGAVPLRFDLNLAGRQLNLSLGGNPAVAPGEAFATGFHGITGGPVIVTETGGQEALVSRRILWRGVALDEVPATGADRLADHYYWPWYDQQSPGFADWIMLANPGEDPVYYEITIAGQDPGPGASGTIAPGALAASAFPGTSGGPVEVRAWTGPDKAAPATVAASQRVLSGYGTAFNEMPGIPAAELADSYLWSWYDTVGTAGRDWLMLANPGDGPLELYYRVTVGDSEEVACAGPLAPGTHAFWKKEDTVAGPVALSAFSDSGCSRPAAAIASRRTLWGPSFEETPGTPATALASAYHWTWYDQQTPGALNWVMLANPNTEPVFYEITVAGASPGAGAEGILAPGASAFPAFPGRIGGPVSVNAWQTQPDGSPDRSRPAPILAAQRVLWSGYFNEMQGTVAGP